jgi:hypothetical protein
MPVILQADPLETQYAGLTNLAKMARLIVDSEPIANVNSLFKSGRDAGKALAAEKIRFFSGKIF